MKLFFICLVIISPAICFSQNLQGKIKYELKMNNTSQNSIREILMFFTQSDYMYEVSNKANIEFGNEANKKYSSVEDSLNDQKNIDHLKELAKNRPQQQWYGNLGTPRIIYSTFDNNFKKYYVKDTTELIQWTLLEDTLTIKDIKCQKASGLFMGSQYKAWFAINIPTSCAPIQFRGLPGLLIEATNLSNGTKLSMLDLEWPLKSNVTAQLKPPCEESQLLSKQEFSVIRNKQNGRAMQLIEEIKKQKELEKQGIKSKLTIGDLNIKNN